MKVKLVVDSTIDLPMQYLKDNKIDIVSTIITFGEEEYEDLKQINSAQLYSLVEKKNALPKTSARSSGYFEEVFKKCFEEGYDQIVCITISSIFSSTYQNAYIASQEFKGKVFVHDSLNLSSGEGLQVMRAVDMIKEGKSGAEILETLKDMAPRVRSQFAVETLDYLYKGGRCSGAAYYVGGAFKIKPIIRVVDGKMIVYQKPIGKMVKALNKLLDIFKADLNNLDVDKVMITHSQAYESEKYLYEELKKLIPEERIMITDAGCAISTHCGKGTIGILYVVK